MRRLHVYGVRTWHESYGHSIRRERFDSYENRPVFPARTIGNAKTKAYLVRHRRRKLFFLLFISYSLSRKKNVRYRATINDCRNELYRFALLIVPVIST